MQRQDTELIEFEMLYKVLYFKMKDEASSDLSAWLSYARNKGRSRCISHVMIQYHRGDNFARDHGKGRSLKIGVTLIYCYA